MLDSLDDAYKPWMERAICADFPEPDLWFPDVTTAGGSYKEVAVQVERAIAICNGCPVRLKCLTMALENGEKEGVWGGVNFGPERAGKKSSKPVAEKKPRRTATRCVRGHRWTPENTRICKGGERRCRECARQDRRAAYRRSLEKGKDAA